MRISVSLIVPDLSACAMPLRKMLMNHSSEYWYIGSMLDRSETQKKSIWVLTATGMYWLRVTSISLSVCSAICTFDCHTDNSSRCKFKIYFGSIKQIYEFLEKLQTVWQYTRYYSSLPTPKMTHETGQLSVLMSVPCHHFHNAKAPRPLGWGRWKLARIFYELGDKTSRKRNFEFWSLHRAGDTASPELADLSLYVDLYFTINMVVTTTLNSNLN